MLDITPLAAGHVRRALAERGAGVGIRLLVTASACSGLSYQLEFADHWEAHELQFVSRQITLGISPKSLPLVHGALIDFMQDGEEAGFIIHNPNVRSRCECGESFHV